MDANKDQEATYYDPKEKRKLLKDLTKLSED